MPLYSNLKLTKSNLREVGFLITLAMLGNTPLSLNQLNLLLKDLVCSEVHIIEKLTPPLFSTVSTAG